MFIDFLFVKLILLYITSCQYIEGKTTFDLRESVCHVLSQSGSVVQLVHINHCFTYHILFETCQRTINKGTF